MLWNCMQPVREQTEGHHGEGEQIWPMLKKSLLLQIGATS